MKNRITIVASVFLLVLVAWAVDWTDAADGVGANVKVGTAPAAGTGSADTSSLGRMLGELGIAPRVTGTRFDFEFASREEDQEWAFAMSVVLSQDAGTVWVMAWLEEMPGQASKVPAAALLRMLSANDSLGNGKFFAYDRRNRRFLMQRVLPNRGITASGLRGVFQDIARGVIVSHSTWSLARWSEAPEVQQSTLPPAPAAERRR